MKATAERPGKIRLMSAQRGVAALWAIFFMIVGVMVTLTQVYDISGARSTITSQQGDSTVAFFAAESGLQAMSSKIRYSTNMANTCTTSISSNLDTGTGSNYLYSVSSAYAGSNCSTACSTCACCTITSTGTYGTASRTVEQVVRIVPGTTGGTTCVTSNACKNTSYPPIWTLNGTNNTTYPAVAIVHLAAGLQSSWSGSLCPTSPSADALLCTSTVQWAVDSNPGQSSVASQGNKWDLPPGESTGNFWASIVSNRPEPIAVHGVLYPSTAVNSTPSFKGAYWKESQGNNIYTTFKANSGTTPTGHTNNGAAASSGTCYQPDSTHTEQTCTNWCYGADRMSYAAAVWSANSQATTERLRNFDFNGVPFYSDNVESTCSPYGVSPKRTNCIHFPDQDTNPSNPENAVYSEIWTKYNPWYLYGAKTVLGASATDTRIDINQTGVTSTPDFRATTTSGSPNVSVSVSGTPTERLKVGDKVTGLSSYFPAGTYYILTGPSNGLTGTYTLTTDSSGQGSAVNANASTATSQQITTTRHVLTVTGIESGSIAVGQHVSSLKTTNPNTNNVPAGTTIADLGTGTGGTGTYYLWMTTAQAVTATDRIFSTGAYTSANRIFVRNASTMPTAGTILNVRSAGTIGGQFRATPQNYVYVTTTSSTGVANGCPIYDGTSGTNPYSFCVSATLGGNALTTTSLDGAQLCGGACAFFDHTNTETAYTFTKPDNNDYVASGFFCMSGADGNPSIISVGSTVVTDRWREVVTTP